MDDQEKYYEPLEFYVTDQDNRNKLGDFLRKKLQLSRRLIVKLKATEKGLTINEEPVWVSHRVYTGDVVRLRFQVETSETILPEKMALSIIYEDDYFLVVNKPAGLIVHPTTGHYTNTLANGVMDYWRQKNMQFRFRPIHRIDKQTSGLVVIAKNALVQHQFGNLAAFGEVEKVYTTYVFGRPPENKGKVEAAIARAEDEPHRRIVQKKGAYALTYYEVERYFGEQSSRLKIRICTGRTHQIRVHMHHLGCPIIGDPIYFDKSKEETSPVSILAHDLQGQALHAHHLHFLHPITGKLLHLEAPLPSKLIKLEQELCELFLP